MGFQANYHLIVMISLAVFAGTISMNSSGMMGKKVTDSEYLDLWFDADLPWVFDNMSNLDSLHRTKRGDFTAECVKNWVETINRGLKIVEFSACWTYKLAHHSHTIRWM